jgi:hypothetical protein
MNEEEENQQEGSLDRRKRLFPDYKKNRLRNQGRFAGLNDDQIRQKIAEEDAQRAKDAEDERVDQDPELNKQREDMKQGDFLQDPEEYNFLRLGASITTEVGLNLLLDVFSAAPPVQGIVSPWINYLAQKIRGEKDINELEMVAAGIASQIPLIGSLKGVTKAGKFGKSVARGALSGAIEETGYSLGRGEEADPFAGALFGGTVGGVFNARNAPAAFDAIKAKLNTGSSDLLNKLAVPEGTLGRGIDTPDDFQPASTFAAKTEQPSFDDELNRRYKEINNPDSYVTDRASPDYGKLKSEVEPVRAAEAAADKKIYDAERLELDKKFIMEHPLGLDNLVPDNTVLDLKKESRQVAALMWDINYPFEDKKGFRYFDQQIREAMERQFPGQDLKLRSHHLNPLKSGAAMLNGLSMEDRAEATARLLDEFGLVGGNSPFQNTVLPREIHNEVHRFLSRFSTRYLSEIGDPQFDNSFYRLSLEGRMPMLKRYAQMIRQSEELIFTLMQAQNIASGAVDTVVTPEVASNILSKIPTNTTDTTFKFLQDAYDDIKIDILERLGEDTIGIGGGTDINIAPKGATLKTRRRFGKLQTNPEKFVASDSEYRSMALDRIFKFRRNRQLDIFETEESLRAEIAKIAKRLKQEDLDPRRGRFRK